MESLCHRKTRGQLSIWQWPGASTYAMCSLTADNVSCLWEWTIRRIQISIFCQTLDFQSQTLVTSLTVATAELSSAASHMCQFYCRILTLFLINIVLGNNSSVVNNLCHTIFQEYRRIGHWITTDIYTKKKKKYWEKCVCWCLLACLFIYSFVYLLFGSGSINYSWTCFFKSKQIHFASTGFSLFKAAGLCFW